METKINNQEEYSPETLEYFNKVTEALHQSAKEAAKIAARTGTPLVIYDQEKGIQEVMVSGKDLS